MGTSCADICAKGFRGGLPNPLFLADLAFPIGLLLWIWCRAQSAHRDSWPSRSGSHRRPAHAIGAWSWVDSFPDAGKVQL